MRRRNAGPGDPRRADRGYSAPGGLAPHPLEQRVLHIIRSSPTRERWLRAGPVRLHQPLEARSPAAWSLEPTSSR